MQNIVFFCILFVFNIKKLIFHLRYSQKKFIQFLFCFIIVSFNQIYPFFTIMHIDIYFYIVRIYFDRASSFFSKYHYFNSIHQYFFILVPRQMCCSQMLCVFVFSIKTIFFILLIVCFFLFLFSICRCVHIIQWIFLFYYLFSDFFLFL